MDEEEESQGPSLCPREQRGQMSGDTATCRQKVVDTDLSSSLIPERVRFKDPSRAAELAGQVRAVS